MKNDLAKTAESIEKGISIWREDPEEFSKWVIDFEDVCKKFITSVKEGNRMEKFWKEVEDGDYQYWLTDYDVINEGQFDDILKNDLTKIS